MPPKKTTPATKAAPKSTTAAKPGTTKTGTTKTGTAKTGTAAKSTTSKTTAPAAKSKAAPKEEPKPAAAPVRKPVTFVEIPFKEIDAKVVYDKEGTVEASGKWPLVVDENGLTPRFLRHRDVNMLTSADQSDMDPEKIRKMLIASIKFGKPMIIDMMASEMYEFCRDKFNEIEADLFENILNKSIIGDDYKFMSLVKEEDGPDFQNQYDFRQDGFSFIITTELAAPNEELMQKVYPVKVLN